MDLQTIGTAGGGSIVGVILAFLGFKSRLDSIEKKVCGKVDEKTCIAVKEGMNQRFDDLKDGLDTRFDTIEHLIVGGKK